MEGPWTVDEFQHEHYNIRDCFYNSHITFEDNSYCNFPKMLRCGDLVEYVKMGTWSIVKTDSIPVVLSFSTRNRLFNGNHQVIFYGDETNKVLRMELISGHSYILCHKGLFYYDQNTALIDYLVQMTQESNNPH